MNGVATIPNVISLFRLLAVPLTLWLLLEQAFTTAFWLFLVASFSDGVDGFIAKRLNSRTTLGAYLDPIADKALLMGVYIVLGLEGHLPMWLVTLAVFRDAVIVGGAMVFQGLTNQLRMQPLLSGKLNTLAQILLAGFVLAGLGLELPVAALTELLIYFVAVSILFSGGCYLVVWSQRAAESEE
ncbi:MAG: CDP-alcohol phosphatidyltransferase family protein [Alphaproteobacteria bacterium]|nr:CDP-alcohol phosphatidyltransferase family protein [Alphaproteobacteria bacterium]